MRLVQSSLDANNIHFEVVYGVSANQRGWYANPGAVKIGYVPLENAEDHVMEVEAHPDSEDEVGRRFEMEGVAERVGNGVSEKEAR